MNLADQSNCETGYIIYRDSGFSGQFKQIMKVISGIPSAHDSLTLFDATVAPNCWYRYEAEAYMADSTAYTGYSTIFTFKSQKPNQIAKFTKLSNYAISDSGGWSAIAGDSIILKETTAPTGKYTVINVKNPAVPISEGYIDSTTLMSYPMSTLIPAYLKFGVSNGFGPAGTSIIYEGGDIIVGQTTMIRLYQVGASGLSQFDSLKIDTCYECSQGITGMLRLNDSVIVISEEQRSEVSTLYLCFPLQKFATGYIKDSTVQIGSYYIHSDGVQNDASFIRGLNNGNLEIAVNNNCFGGFVSLSSGNVPP